MSARAKLAQTERENSQLRVKINTLQKQLTEKDLVISKLKLEVSRLLRQTKDNPFPSDMRYKKSTPNEGGIE